MAHGRGNQDGAFNFQLGIMDNISLNDDKNFLRLIENGNQKAFKKFFDKYYDFVFQTSCLYCTFHDAEEVAGDIFSKLWINRDQLSEISNLNNYLFIAAKNQCLNYLRKKKIQTSEVESVFDYLADQASNPLYQIEVDELKKRVEKIIESLPPKQREAFHLVREEGLSYKEAARHLSISENTLDSHLKKASRQILNFIRMVKTTILIFFP